MSDAVNLRIDPRTGERNWTDPFSEELVVEELEELPGVFGVILTQVPHPTSIEVYRALDPSVALDRVFVVTEPGSGQFWSDSQQLKSRGYVIVNSTLYGEGLIIVYRGGGYLAHKRVLETVIPEGPPGPPGGVDTVFTRSGDVVAQTGDYTQDQVTDGSTYKQYSQTEKTKLAGISTGADVTNTAINATNKATIADNDRFSGADSASSNGTVYWLWSLIKSTLNAIYLARFTSTGQTITSAGSLTIAHGLGAEPFIVGAFLQCTTAENGYSVGDKLYCAPHNLSTSNTEGYGISLSFNGSTNINVRFGSQTTVFIANHKTTGALTGLTNGNWQLYVFAQK